MKIKAFAKLNLNLHVFPKIVETGKHEIHLINCQINLYDILDFQKADEYPLDEDNLIHQAAKLLGLKASVKLQKNIPTLGGLGGGSADAAATLRGLVKLYKLKISERKLEKMADTLGSDVSYCLKGGLCEITGDGNIVKKLNYKLPKLYLIIIYPKQIKPSTGEMYQGLDNQLIGQNITYLDRLKKAIKNNNPKEIIANLFNDFELSAIKKYGEILQIKNDFKKYGALNAILLGSGLGVVGFFETKETRNKSFNYLNKIYKNIIKTETL